MAKTTFAGRTALITGADGGIGRALALGLGRRRAIVWALDPEPEAAEATADRVRALGVEARGAGLRVAAFLGDVVTLVWDQVESEPG